MVHGVFVRSTMAYAKITNIDTSAALQAGALLVLTADALPFADRSFFLRYTNPNIREGLVKFLAKDYVRYVGEPIAFLVATDRYIAEDLAALVEVDLEPIDTVPTTEAALKEGAPQLHPRWDRNIAAQLGRVKGNPEQALTRCERTLTRRFYFGRQTPLPLETRGCVADFDTHRQSLCLYTSSQTHYAVRQNLSALLDMPETSIRVIAENVGGSFGSKSRPYPEEMVVSHASRLLARPVKWIEDRFENLQATTQSRAIETELTIGYDVNGKLLALTAKMTADIGAYVYTSGIITAEVAGAMICGPYDIPHTKVDVLCVGTNKTPLATFRGAGQPEATFPMESLLDLIAKDLGISPYELRRRNIVSPNDYPYQVWAPGPAGVSELESGNYPGMLARTVEDSGYSQAVESIGKGEVAAWGLACGLEITGFINFESAKVRIEPTGAVTVWSGITSQGQSQFTTYAQVCAEVLGTKVDDVTVHLGDTDALPFGQGGFASRGAVMGANAVAGAAQRLRAKALTCASKLLSVNSEALTLQHGKVFRIDGSPTDLTLAKLAQAVRPGGELFTGEAALEEQYVYDNKNKLTFVMSVHAARVAVNLQTGFVRVLDYFVTHDIGRALNEVVVEGQLVGGVAEGISCALYSEIVHDEDGQLQTGTLADYLVVTAPEIPRIRLAHMESIPTTNPLGVRGVGEGGVIAVPPAIVNAISHAISPGKIGHEEPLFSLPVRPPRVLEAIKRAASLSSN